eukprot:6463656-Amphidinium_carterae.1
MADVTIFLYDYSVIIHEMSSSSLLEDVKDIIVVELQTNSEIALNAITKSGMHSATHKSDSPQP